MSIEKALEAVRKGQIILIYDFDDRERESDMTVASEFITYDNLRYLIRDFGTAAGEVAREFGKIVYNGSGDTVFGTVQPG